METELRQINGNTEKLRRSHSELVELQLVLEKAGGRGGGLVDVTILSGVHWGILPDFTITGAVDSTGGNLGEYDHIERYPMGI